MAESVPENEAFWIRGGERDVLKRAVLRNLDFVGGSVLIIMMTKL